MSWSRMHERKCFVIYLFLGGIASLEKPAVRPTAHIHTWTRQTALVVTQRARRLSDALPKISSTKSLV